MTNSAAELRPSRPLEFSRLKWVGLFVLICALLFARFPEPLTKPTTFLVETGTVYFQDWYNLSFWQAVSNPYAGYYCVFPRLLAELCGVFPYRYLPFVYALISLSAAGAILSFFYAPYFRRIVSADWQRFVICVSLCAAPALQSLEHFEALHFFLAVFLVLVAIMSLPARWPGKASVGSAAVLSAWSAPVALVLTPVFAIRALDRGAARTDRAFFGAIAAALVGFAASVRHLYVADSVELASIPGVSWHAVAYRVAALGLLGEKFAGRLASAFGWYGMLPALLALLVLIAIGVWVERRRKSSLLVPFTCLWVIFATPSLVALRLDSALPFVRFDPQFQYWSNDRYFLPAAVILFLYVGVLWTRQRRRRVLVTAIWLCWCACMFLWGYRFYPWTSWGPSFANYWQSIERAERNAAADGKIHRLYIPIAPEPWFVVLDAGKAKERLAAPQEVVLPPIKISDYFNLDRSMNDGFRHSSWLGAFDDSTYPWLHTERYGWMSCIQPDKGGVWFWSPAQGYFWTNALRFPSVYSDRQKSWITLPVQPAQ